MIDIGALFEEHQGEVVRYLLARCHDQQLAEDLAQQTWEKAQRSAGSYTDQGNKPKAWLFTIARNLLIDHVRRVELVRFTPISLLPEFAAVTDDQAEPTLGRLELDLLLARLTEKQGAVIRARYVAGMSVRETSQALGIGEEAVKQLQRRALANLKYMLTSSRVVEDAA